METLGVLLLPILAVVAFFGMVGLLKSRYITCPSNQILVKYGRVGKGRSAATYHGGATFVWPLIQQKAMLDLTPITTDIDLKNALSKQNIRVNVPSRFTFGIGTTEELMSNAAERLLGLGQDAIEEIARDIIFGQLRATLATMDIEEINANREIFEEKVTDNIESELKKVGLRVINVNITDIQDESGYISALGERAAAEAINRAKVEVAEQVRDGETGAANAKQEERVNVAAANAKAVTGENQAAVSIADSDAQRREAEAEAKRRGDAAEAVKSAAATKAGHEAERETELARAERVKAAQQADVIVPEQIAREQTEIKAAADKARTVLAGEAAGEARRAEQRGVAEGLSAVLSSKAEGLAKVVEAAGGRPDQAALLLVVEQLPEVARLQTQAIANIRFDKIVVMDQGAQGTDGSTTAAWLSNLTKALPGLHEVADMAGLKLPEALGASLEGQSRGHSGGFAVRERFDQPTTPPSPAAVNTAVTSGETGEAPA
ncbi:MAG: flotillin family protein [Candidatus Competibacterales bacterium]